MPSPSQPALSRIATVVAAIAILAGFAGIAVSQPNDGGAPPVVISGIGCANPADLNVVLNESENIFLYLQAKCDSLAGYYGFSQGVLQPSLGSGHLCELGDQYWVCSGVGASCNDLNCTDSSH